MSFLTPQSTLDDVAFLFDDPVMTFDGWFLDPVAFIYLEGSYRPNVTLASTHDPDPDLSGAV